MVGMTLFSMESGVELRFDDTDAFAFSCSLTSETSLPSCFVDVEENITVLSQLTIKALYISGLFDPALNLVELLPGSDSSRRGLPNVS